VGEVSWDAIEDGVRDSVKTAGGGMCGEAVAEVDNRAHGEAPMLGGKVGTLEHRSWSMEHEEWRGMLE
jgi:hypothetical protein